MASQSEAESQWLAQVATMRAAIAELKLLPVQGEMYGADLVYDGTSDSSAEEDIWDFSSEDDLQKINGSLSPEQTYNQDWLQQRCQQFSNSRPGIAAGDVLQQILSAIASEPSEDRLQAGLADILGFDDLDFVIEIIAHKQALLPAPQTGHSGSGHVLGRLRTKREREAALRQQDFDHKNALLAPALDRTEERLPHVYKSHSAGNVLDAAGRKHVLPTGSSRIDHEKYEEYAIPATKIGTLAAGRKLVSVSEMDGLCQRTFKGYENLNSMQSLLYHVAYRTSENMLICAPTGAGKTDAAMLTILHAISQNISPSPLDDPGTTQFTVQLDDFKIVYVAPMKALAAEVTEKLGKRLQWLGIQVRELTGDMQLTKERSWQPRSL